VRKRPSYSKEFKDSIISKIGLAYGVGHLLN
jgi:hypothetical protein